MASERAGEVVCVHPSPPERARPVRAVRSTLVTTGLVALRTRKLFDRYNDALPPPQRDRVAGIVAGTWLPTDFMLAHYAAWDSLGLSAEDIRGIGASVASGVSENMLLALKHLTTGAGVTPWTALAQHGRLWSRAFDGGGARIEKAGPKDATLAFVEVPFARSLYFQGSIVAVHERALGAFSTKLYARIVPGSVGDASFVMKLSWV